ncbi:MAG: type II toxin-antitoxin system PemK/MazF family toxin [Desulfosporosinus sp.]|nr:type II toxin-antitoxin system PemK/MazF family toxin [Desulfosporosinus sp.]
MDEKELLEENNRYKRNTIHFLWGIGVLIFVLIMTLSYKFWGKSGNLENLISIGSGLVSMTLALVAIFIALSEGIKTSNKEARLDVTLSQITLNTKKTEDILNKIQPKVDNIDLKTDTYLANLAKAYSSVETPSNETPSVEPPSNDADNVERHSETDDNIGGDKIITKPAPHDETLNLTGKVYATSNITGEVTVRQERVFKGKVFLADLNPVVGSEQGGTRPVIIVSNDIVNKYSPNVTVVPCTSRVGKAMIPTHVPLGFLINQNHESFAVVHQIRTIDRSRLSELLASLDEDTITKIDNAIDIQIGIVRS